MKTEEKVFTFLLLLLVSFMVFLTFSYRPGARMVPLLVGICTFLFMTFLCIMTISSKFALWYRNLEGDLFSSLKGEAEGSDSLEEDIDLPSIRLKERSVIGWLLFLTAGTYIFGFLIAIPLFLFLFLKTWAKEGWVLSLCISGMVTGIVFLVFQHLLHVPFHKGILFN